MSGKSMCATGLVRGKVQGVWFRRFVQQCAEPLGVTGYAKNLPDGSVEILLCGDAEAVGKVQQQVAIGPPDAQVDDLHWREQPCLDVPNFSVR